MEYVLWDAYYTTLWGRILFSATFIAGGLAGALLFSSGRPRRRWFFVRVVACFAVSGTVSFYLFPWASLSRNTALLIFAYLVMFGMIVGSAWLCNDCGLRSAIFYAENGVAAFSVVKLIFDSIGAITIYAGIHIRPYGAVYSVIYIGLGAVVYVLLYWLLKKQSRTSLSVAPLHLLLPTSVILAVSVIFNILFGKFTYAYSLEADIIVAIKLILLLCCLLVLMINFDVFTINRQRHEMETISQLSKKQQEQFAFSKANIDALNMKYHDLKGMIGSLRKVADQNIAAPLREAEVQIDAYDKTAKTGNTYLDVLLTERSIYCEHNGIRFTYSVEGEALSFMQPMDVISFFDNCTGNAIEAVMQLPPEKRVVTLQCSRRQGMLSVRCDNYFSGQLRLAGGLPATSKQNAAEHGFGLKSMQLIAKKYGGQLTVSAEGEIFTLTAVIPC